MCGILVGIAKKQKLDYRLFVDSLRKTATRGPDYTFYYYNNSLFLGVNVLSITGDSTPRTHQNNVGALAYNGEIYNYNMHDYPTDTVFLLDELSKKDPTSVIKSLNGMFGLAFYNKKTNQIIFARDVFGEKTLYVYEDDNQIIVSSTICGIEAVIGKLEIDTELLYSYFFTRHFLTYNKTVYKKVRQILPGTIETYDINGRHNKTITFDNITKYIDNDVINKRESCSVEELAEELDVILSETVRCMIPDKHVCVSFSGGVDSSLIAYYTSQHTDRYTLVGTNCIGKDTISSRLDVFQPYFKNKILTLDIDCDYWCEKSKHVYNIILQPAGSHNFCTKLILAEFLKQKKIKVMLGGEGADELFGGYNFYTDMSSKSDVNVSPYSGKLLSDIVFLKQNTKFNCDILDKTWCLSRKLSTDAVTATSLADTLLVVNDDGVRNTDQIAGWLGIEGRSPFLHRDIVKFALNLPSKYKRGKPLLKMLYKQKFNNTPLYEKQGFAGFPNETLSYYKMSLDNLRIFDILGIKKTDEYKRDTVWKLLNLEFFYESYNSRNILNIT